MANVRRPAAVAVVLAALVGASLSGGSATSAATSRAGIVVQHGDLGVVTDCVAFEEASIDGFELVDRSRFDHLVASFSFGDAMCWLDGEGCETGDPDGCFACDPVNSWGYWVQGPGEDMPASAETGAGDREVVDGVVDYWLWAPFGVPPLTSMSFDEVCAGVSGSPDTGTGSGSGGAGSDGGSAAVSGAGDARVPLPATR